MTICLRRREFIAGLGGAAHPDELSAFHKGLGEFGYVEAAT